MPVPVPTKRDVAQVIAIGIGLVLFSPLIAVGLAVRGISRAAGRKIIRSWRARRYDKILRASWKAAHPEGTIERELEKALAEKNMDRDAGDHTVFARVRAGVLLYLMGDLHTAYFFLSVPWRPPPPHYPQPTDAFVDIVWTANFLAGFTALALKKVEAARLHFDTCLQICRVRPHPSPNEAKRRLLQSLIMKSSVSLQMLQSLLVDLDTRGEDDEHGEAADGVAATQASMYVNEPPLATLGELLQEVDECQRTLTQLLHHDDDAESDVTPRVDADVEARGWFLCAQIMVVTGVHQGVTQQSWAALRAGMNRLDRVARLIRLVEEDAAKEILGAVVADERRQDEFDSKVDPDVVVTGVPATETLSADPLQLSAALADGAAGVTVAEVLSLRAQLHYALGEANEATAALASAQALDADVPFSAPYTSAEELARVVPGTDPMRGLLRPWPLPQPQQEGNDDVDVVPLRRHDMEVVRFIKPTWCDECTRYIRIKGLRCKKCGIRVHYSGGGCSMANLGGACYLDPLSAVPSRSPPPNHVHILRARRVHSLHECAHCNKVIMAMTHASHCTSCDVFVHTKCAAAMPGAVSDMPVQSPTYDNQNYGRM